MRQIWIAIATLVIGISTSSCGSEKLVSSIIGGPCDGENAASGCGATCGSASSKFCEAGLHCGSDNRCTAECDVNNENSCGEGKICSNNGYCLDKTDGDGNGNGCPAAIVDTARKTPNIVIVLDRSGSMTEKLAGGDVTATEPSRWSIVQDFLLGKKTSGTRSGGFLKEMESQANFSLAMYDAKWDNDSTVRTCPRLLSTQGTNPFIPRADNVADITTLLDSSTPSGDTPTGPAILSILESFGTIADDGDPTIFLLATDGGPDNCEFRNPSDRQVCRQRPELSYCNATPKPTTTVGDYVEMRAVEAVQAALLKNIRTYVIGVGRQSDGVQAHFAELSKAGVKPGETPIYRNGDQQGVLEDAFEEIIDANLSCKVELNGKVVGDPCLGTVTINGEPHPLTCNPGNGNGWKLTSPTEIEILGPACDRLKMSKTPKVDTKFPCGVVVEVS